MVATQTAGAARRPARKRDSGDRHRQLPRDVFAGAAASKAARRLALQIQPVMPPRWEFNQSMYCRVGADWSWQDKRAWDEARWQAYAEAPGLYTFAVNWAGEPVGYFELRQDQHGGIEIVYFGLLRETHRQGPGRARRPEQGSGTCVAARTRAGLGSYLYARPPLSARELPGPGHAYLPHRNRNRIRIRKRLAQLQWPLRENPYRTPGSLCFGDLLSN